MEQLYTINQKKSIFLAIFLLLIIPGMYGQSNTNEFEEELALLDLVKQTGQSKLGMYIPDHFYTNWTLSETANLYLYVSSKDSIHGYQNKNFFGYGYYTERAITALNLYESLGYATLLYKTYGTSQTVLSKHLLSYSIESILFIGFHEATHLHLFRHGNIPYIITEALCDLIGNYGSLYMAKEEEHIDFEKMKSFTTKLEGISNQINNCISIIESKETLKLESANNRLKELIQSLDKQKDQFMVERYDYNINNAYFIRNRSYTKYYFKLKTLMFQFDDLKSFLNFIVSIPKTEQEALFAIEEEIRNRS